MLSTLKTSRRMSPKELNSDVFYKKWVLMYSLFNVMSVLICFWQESLLPLLVVNVCSFSFYLSRIKSYLIGFDAYIGFANWVTLLRLLVIIISGFLSNLLSNHVVFIFFSLAIAMDGLDGYLARRFKHMSIFGARFDMETDAFMVLLMSYLLYSRQLVGMWIILPGALRYIYQLLFSWLPTSELPSKKIRSTIAVIFFISLSMGFIMPRYLTLPLLFTSSILIVFSFSISIIGGLRQKYD